MTYLVCYSHSDLVSVTNYKQLAVHTSWKRFSLILQSVLHLKYIHIMFSWQTLTLKLWCYQHVDLVSVEYKTNTLATAAGKSSGGNDQASPWLHAVAHHCSNVRVPNWNITGKITKFICYPVHVQQGLCIQLWFIYVYLPPKFLNHVHKRPAPLICMYYYVCMYMYVEL